MIFIERFYSTSRTGLITKCCTIAMLWTLSQKREGILKVTCGIQCGLISIVPGILNARGIIELAALAASARILNRRIP